MIDYCEATDHIKTLDCNWLEAFLQERELTQAGTLYSDQKKQVPTEAGLGNEGMKQAAVIHMGDCGQLGS